MKLMLRHEGRSTYVQDEESGRDVEGPFSSPGAAEHWIQDNGHRVERAEALRQQAIAREKEGAGK